MLIVILTISTVLVAAKLLLPKLSTATTEKVNCCPRVPVIDLDVLAELLVAGTVCLELSYHSILKLEIDPLASELTAHKHDYVAFWYQQEFQIQSK